MTKFFAIPLGVLAMGLAAQASAVTVSFHFTGTGNPLGVFPFVTATSITNEAAATVNATGLSYAYVPALADPSDPFGVFPGSGVLNLADGSLQFSLYGAQTSGGNLASSIVSFTGISGAYLGASGTGTLTHTYVGSSKVEGQFEAEIAAVPEPASMLALGLGAAAMVRRRTRKANA